MTRIRQTGVVLLGLVTAAVMVLLGIWQLEVYQAQGVDAAQRRAAEPPVPLSSVAAAGSPVRDGYGRSVLVRGRYLPDQQLLLPTALGDGTSRVLTALRQPDGSVLPVVRGLTNSDVAPEPPVGELSQTGVFLPSEDAAAGSGDVELSSVRVPALAQQWPTPMVDGFVTLAANDSVAGGLAPASVSLPEGRGRLRNGAYAVQWWVFAAFAFGMGVRIARDIGRRDLLAEPLAADPTDPATPGVDEPSPSGNP